MDQATQDRGDAYRRPRSKPFRRYPKNDRPEDQLLYKCTDEGTGKRSDEGQPDQVISIDTVKIQKPQNRNDQAEQSNAQEGTQTQFSQRLRMAQFRHIASFHEV